MPGKAQDYADQLKAVEENILKLSVPYCLREHKILYLPNLKIYFNELEDILQSVYNLRELSLQTKDLILSYGERCSNVMVSHIAKQQFPEALYVDGSELIKTDSNFGQAKVNTELTEILIRDFYAK